MQTPSPNDPTPNTESILFRARGTGSMWVSSTEKPGGTGGQLQFPGLSHPRSKFLNANLNGTCFLAFLTGHVLMGKAGDNDSLTVLGVTSSWPHSNRTAELRQARSAFYGRGKGCSEGLRDSCCRGRVRELTSLSLSCGGPLDMAHAAPGGVVILGGGLLDHGLRHSITRSSFF